MDDQSLMEPNRHHDYMGMALDEAMKAWDEDEVPVGAVLVGENGEVLAACHNRVIGMNDPTAHAEMSAIREAAAGLRNYRLINSTLYVTIEPCAMCMGAVIHARVAVVVYGAPDLKWGAAGSLYDFSAEEKFNHKPIIVRGVRESECAQLMRRFFMDKRKRRN